MAGLYDVCVVGAGMVGSAAARHASLAKPDGIQRRVCLIGPSEPKPKDIRSPRTIFGCYYDEGRIVREMDPSVTWSVLASKSIQRYRDIEDISGVRFYFEKGFLGSGTEGNGFVSNLQNVKATNNIDSAAYLTNREIVEEFPYFNFRKDDVGFYQKRNAGYVNPRGLVLAQQRAARKQGCDIIEDIVTEVKETQQDGCPVMSINTESGKTVVARKVLLATNGFTNFHKLLPDGMTLDIRPFASCVSFVQVTEETAKRLSDMPTVIYRGYGNTDWRPDPGDINTSDQYAFYCLPPVLYPDGGIYIKLGTVHKEKPSLDTAEEIKRWYCNPPPQHLVHNQASLITSFLKGIKPLSISGDTCVTVYTATGLPYIDRISTNLAVAVGGNGGAAKSSDEIGRLGVELAMDGKWNSELSREQFRVKLKLQSKF